MAKAKGYDQVLWLDAREFEYVRSGTMNIFFKIAGNFITPNLNGSVLSGITRLSVIDLLRDKGFEVTERPISMTEIVTLKAELWRKLWCGNCSFYSTGGRNRVQGHEDYFPRGSAGWKGRENGFGRHQDPTD
jgi:hypothetical protein